MTGQETRNAERANFMAKPMFALSIVFIVLLAALVVVWVDIPRVAFLANAAPEAPGTAEAVAEQAEQIARHGPLEERAAFIGIWLFLGLITIWPIFWIEFLVNYFSAPGKKLFRTSQIDDALVCLIPPLRLGTTIDSMQGRIWLPYIGWQTPGKQLSRLLERVFGKPMLVIALLILPILLIEFGLKSLVENYFGLRLTLHIVTGFIWCAFAIEFIVMVSATDRKLDYIKRNWVDLAIILLPLISFLRSLRALRILRFAKVQQLAKMGRVYRMRSLLAKAFRAMMLFEIIHRILRVTPKKKLAKLKIQYADRAEELEELRREIETLEKQIESDDEKENPGSSEDNPHSNDSNIQVA